jgi:hypothetical protein
LVMLDAFSNAMVLYSRSARRALSCPESIVA